MSKYQNIQTRIGDKVYDSRKEARRAMELRLMERAGEIEGLEEQKRYMLLPAQDGEKPVYYVADFRYVDNRTGEVVVEDVKGVRTKEYILKRKMMLFFFNIKVREV